MHIGVPKEIKHDEYRVGLTPENVGELTRRGHTVWIERDAGIGIGLTDDTYRNAGAKIVSDNVEVFAKAEMIIKVKEPQPEECALLKEGQLLFTFLHLAADPHQADLLLASGCVAIAYETVTDASGGLPLLTPMSEIAGHLSMQAAAMCLEKAYGGRGVLLGGVPGVLPAKVVILGGGVSGTRALRMAIGMGADVLVLDKSLKRLRELETLFASRLKTCYASAEKIEKYVSRADVVIGAILVPGAAASKIVTRHMLSQMSPGSVVVDVAIDQGGCFETSRPTSHSKPTFLEEGVVHYCVSNMPAAVPLTSVFALNNATLPFVHQLADRGYRAACLENPHLLNGLTVCQGKITHAAVAAALNKTYTPPERALETAI